MFSIFVVEDNDAIIGSLTLCNNLFPFTVCLAFATSVCFLAGGKHLRHVMHFNDQVWTLQRFGRSVKLERRKKNTDDQIVLMSICSS